MNPSVVMTPGLFVEGRGGRPSGCRSQAVLRGGREGKEDMIGAENLPGIVDAPASDADIAVGQFIEVLHLPILPQEGVPGDLHMPRTAPLDLARLANDLAGVIEVMC